MSDATDVSRRGFVQGMAIAGAAGVAGVVGAAGIAGMAGTVDSAHADEAAGDDLDMDSLRAWLQDRSHYSAAQGAMYFLAGDENAPTDDELVEMFRVANSYMWCHGLNAPHFIAVRDPAEQQAIAGSMGVTGDGTVTILVLVDGMKKQELHEEPYSDRKQATGPGSHYLWLYLGLEEAGQAHAYLNLAARTLGYRIRNLGALNIPNLSYEAGLGDQEDSEIMECFGNWAYANEENWDISKYGLPKDGGERVTHYISTIDKSVDVANNLSLAFVIIMGRVDESKVNNAPWVMANYGDLDTMSSATTYSPMVAHTGTAADQTKIEYNFSLWDSGVDGSTLHVAPEEFQEYIDSYGTQDNSESASDYLDSVGVGK